MMRIGRERATTASVEDAGRPGSYKGKNDVILVMQIRKMAAAVLRALARWVEGFFVAPGELDSQVSEALDAILLDGQRRLSTHQPRADQADDIGQGRCFSLP